MAVVTFKSRRLAVAFAKDPATAEPKYYAEDVSEIKRFERTPMLMRLTSRRKVKYVTDILRELFTAYGLADKALTVELAPAEAKTKEALMAEGLIRLRK